MDLMLLRVFQRQVADQCKFVSASVPIINQAASTGDHDQLWVGCQMFVGGSGNASKALWGEGRKRKVTAPLREPLRDSLGVDDSSPLFNLSMRNNFEHYDERIDQWWRDSPNHNRLDRMIGPPTAIAGLSAIEMFRIYDPSQSTGPRIVFWGQTYDLQPIADECARIHPIAEQEANKPHWVA